MRFGVSPLDRTVLFGLSLRYLRPCGSGSVLSVAFVNGEVQASAATAKARNFDNTLHYFLSGDTIPEAVYPPLVEIDYTFPLDAPCE